MEKRKGSGANYFTEKEIKKIRKLSSRLSIVQMCDYFGIGVTTYYEMVKRQPEITEAYKKGKSKAIADIAKGLIQDAIDGDNAARIFYLKTQAGWKETSNVEHSGEIKGGTTVLALTSQQQKILDKALDEEF